MADEEYYEEEDEIDLDSITDEQTLIDMLDETEDFDERKRIRDRLMKVQHEIRAKRAEAVRKRENDRDAAIKQKLQDAEDKKKRTLAMYDQMAKSAPAGAQKTMDVNIYKYNDATSRPDSPSVYEGKKDLVEEAIRQRANEAETRKKRILAAFDHAAKSGQAGPKIVNFDEFKRADVTNFTPKKQTFSSCTFGMSSGIPQYDKASLNVPKAKRNEDEEEHLDPMERAIRQRKREADENKRRTLAAYDMIAKSGTVGPKVVILEEFKNLQVSSDLNSGLKIDPTASFHAGVLATGRR